MSDYLTLSEFMNVTRLNESDLIAMFENGELSVSTGPLGELLINVAEVDPEKIARRARRSRSEQRKIDRELLEEMIASEVVNHLDEIIEEALQLALKWTEQEKL